ncbi:polysaccharide biosynthesis tyrosine autokinase [Arenimonas sp.]|uniref:GumC family protein n=1 Tax=Arenimonas sp. TaxID=1872635 RepID=UPI002E3629CE|nr:polysaccharide biosynthesis tyrosine autokinase [Arenimonas sp.]HEX4854366.1 polysaccharide biosynthesis tyrosine autokinase [Arenimonas sp.]
MSQHEPEGQGAGLPAPADDAAASKALAVARSQALSLELRSQDNAENSDEINLLDYWRIIVKRRWTVLGVLAIVLATTLVGTLLMTPVYRASTTVQIERDTIKVVEVEGFTPTESPADRDFYQTQYELLKSRSLAQRVISQLDIASDPAYQDMTAPSPWKALLGGGDEDEETLSADELASKEQRDQTRMTNWFLANLSIEPVRNSRLVRVHFDSEDAEFSRRVVNAVAEAYIASNLDRRFDASTYAKDFLEDRLEQLKLKLEDSEKELVAFAQREKIVDANDGSSLSTQSLGELNTAVAKAQDERIRAEARWRQAESAGGMGLATVLESPIVQTLQEQRAKLSAEYQDKLSVFKPAFPEMLQLKAQIEETERQLAAEVGNIKASIRADYQAALAQEELLKSQVGLLRDEVLDLQSRSIQYNILKREVDTARQQYDALLQRYKEIGIAGGVGTNNISIVDVAETPTNKHKPRLALNLAVGLMLGLFGGVLLAFVFEYLDDTLKAPEDVEKQLGLSVLGVIPMLKAPMTPAKALEDPRSAFAEAYRSVRTALQFATDTGVPRSLLITSSTPSEGKSTTALTLARNFAQLGKRVLIIDADLRNPSLHRTLGVDNSAGLSNYLAGAVKATEVIHATDTPGLMYMSTGPLPPNPAELLMGPKMLSLISIAREKFDQLIIDGPPVMGLADAPILGNLANGTLLVVEAGETRIAVARNALKRLLAARAHVVGGLLTKFSHKHAGDGYGYGGYNYYSYGGQEEQKKLGRR